MSVTLLDRSPVPLRHPDCPTAAEFGLVASGDASEELERAIRQHLAQCGHCQPLLNKMVDHLAIWADRVLYKKHLVWANDSAWFRQYEKYLIPDAVSGWPKTRIVDRRFTLTELAKTVRFTRGSTAECGVLAGVGSAMICKTLDCTYRDGEFHFGFDSFEGLSEPSAQDLTQFAWQSKGALAVTPETARQNLSEFHFVRLIQGWIPDALSLAADHRFRLVHLDLDLYQPTLDSLEFFYSRMNPGGIMVFDDYGHLTCLGVRAAVNEFFADKPEHVIETAPGTAFAFKG